MLVFKSYFLSFDTKCNSDIPRKALKFGLLKLISYLKLKAIVGHSVTASTLVT